MQTIKIEKCPYCGQPISRKELERIHKKIKVEINEKLVEQKQKLRIENEKERIKIEAEKKEITRNKLDLKQSRVSLEREKHAFRKILRKENENQIKEELKKIKDSFTEKAIRLKEEGRKAGRLEADSEKRNLQRSVENLKRQLEKKTADELGSISEEELYKRLLNAFREDKISRIAKGELGADIKHNIFHKGVECGLIIYENKNTKGWQNSFIERAKEYKTMYKTSSIIIVTISFPRNVQNFCLKEGICIVHPSILLPIVDIIRGTILKLHLLNLSKSEAGTKMKEVYKYISGDDFKVQIDNIFSAVNSLQKVQKEEKTRHNNLWVKQNELFDNLQKSAFAVRGKLDNIIQQND